MNITLEQASFIAEILSGIAVIVSLIYVGVGVRHNTRSARLESVHAISTEFNNFYDLLASNRELVDIYHRGTFDIQSLDALEKVRFTLAVTRIFRTFHEQYFQWREGAMDDELWQSWIALCSDVMQGAGVQEIWSIRKRHYGTDFRGIVDGFIADPGDARVLYDQPKA